MSEQKREIRFEIVKAQPEHVPGMYALVRELAEFEQAPEQVLLTEAQMLEYGFGAQPCYEAFVALNNSAVIGTAIYCLRYSTWKGKRLYLDDLVVSEQFRGQGIGRMLFEQTLSEARALQCTGMMWQVLDWNTEARRFYERYHARFDGEWVNCNIDF